MDRKAENVTPGDERRPRDLALLLLAIGTGPPRARARDQQADIAGADLRRRVLDRLAAYDPDPDDFHETLAAIIQEFGAPTGPTRSICSQIAQEWEDQQTAPEAWGWLISEALESAERQERRCGKHANAAE